MGLAREGARVAICARSEERLTAAARHIEAETGGDVLPITGDLSTEDTVAELVARTVEEFGGVDILVNNSGGPPARAFDDIAESQWLEYIDLILMYVMRMCRHAVPHMKRRGNGRIVNLTAFAVKQPFGNTVSNTLRTAVVGLAKTLANEYAGAGILVNNVCTGFIDTELMREEFEAEAEAKGIAEQEPRAALEKIVPLGRLGRVEELADVVTFLASERASYITGVSLQVDGGLVKALL